ncbi:ThuA domain-containing protein [Sphingomonas sp. KC8]|uniref:ThuA domain-containing protein n=1 Tax=Sphingomonas sp. KC8 TaxID=1030157 RepID=UPI0002488633|nr:ThuA domain-containing protein [Sphingomonas sp. KC8]ARS29468.1 glycosyl hydrolase [Sphingomonas sp. KC8]
MKAKGWVLALALLAGFAQSAVAQRGGALATMTEAQKDAIAAKMGPSSPKRYRVLVVGAATGFHHESISAGMTAIAMMGQESGLYDAELRSDFDLINAGGGKKMRFGFQPEGLGDFDAVVLVNTTGEWGLSDSRKQALLAFVHDRGKGLVGIHGALDANYSWQGYADMFGAQFGGHPLNTLEQPLVTFPLVNEAPDSPITRHWPQYFSQQNELYVPKNFSRRNVDVLLRIDQDRIATGPAGTSDIAVAWTRAYGNGRVFYSSIGHTKESWTDPDVRKMYLEAIRWSLGLTNRAGAAK